MKKFDYIVIQAPIISELGLKGNSLLLFAMILPPGVWFFDSMCQTPENSKKKSGIHFWMPDSFEEEGD